MSTHTTRFLSYCLAALFIFPLSLKADSEVAANGDLKPAVALAYTWDSSIDIKGWWMSEKLDGVRGYWTGKTMLSRSGQQLDVPAWFTSNFPATALDGELWLGRQQFSELVSIVRSKHNEEAWKQVRYVIFDAPGIADSFEKRMAATSDWFAQHPSDYAQVLKQEVCADTAHLNKRLKEIEALGGEGLMLRRPESLYLAGRTHDLLKVKTYLDSEAVVVKHVSGTGKNAGRLGALLVRLPNGIEFNIGSGFSDMERDNPPPIGSSITFKYYGLTHNGVPRFASFLRIRETM
ncbi:MAG: DNA ligase [Zetaproteobacteria bacterium CG_4_9_14_3_um_filter_49_83]|nr:MAG: DNA ligase [Zetaproteobacteria bacterium CG1_02_49_23]PIQ30212.1 MAG: DNA ligase [Zetaproteobacteria bacterium CG17_big_fil_post_rev_8_21_14_2_50_50_13]PIV30995.1 MAG: DNA ligase [Zetaproteobacteria bacterium CG02_land_8_20_14_3_00_50_9]PIY55155.1 MAG: DNA ligase [Zetaproteobacteria bacterium CG_4_10_14_0_8_um_filter_49_80]PJA35105.1 MAG: DNA ligase [Zetaproteobacteria bacterium CG_4_9_14_3_um_filter_49_83]